MYLIDRFEQIVSFCPKSELMAGFDKQLSLQLSINGCEEKKDRIELTKLNPCSGKYMGQLRDQMAVAYDAGNASELRYYVFDGLSPNSKQKKMQLSLVRHHGDLVWKIDKDEASFGETVRLYDFLSAYNLLYN